MKRTFALLCLLVLTVGAFSFAEDKAPDPKHEQKQAFMRGKDLFLDESLGTNGMSCNSCHAEGGTKAGKMGDMEIPPFADIGKKYPVYFKMAGKVMTLDQVINFCITTPMAGEALAWDDQRIADLAAYITWVNMVKTKTMKKENTEG